MQRVFVSMVLSLVLLMGCGMNDSGTTQEQQDNARVVEPGNSQDPTTTQRPLNEQAPLPNMYTE